jgi:altronate dehydratase
MTLVALPEIGRIPAPGDNAAIATRRIDAGTRVAIDGAPVTFHWTVLEGHRFAIAPIPAGAALCSWGLPFGYAVRDIRPGEYVCNARVLEALRIRSVDAGLPDAPNLRDTALEPYRLDPARFVPGRALPRHPDAAMRCFAGFDRGRRRGVGTRNHVVILATTSRSGSWARALEERLCDAHERWPNLDRIVAVAHTEGGAGRPNNLELLLRTLAGFVVHPNVGAVLVADQGDEAVTNALLRSYLVEHGYPLDDVPHRFVTLRGDFEDDLDRGEALIRAWLPRVAAAERTPQPASVLRLGLQCGGSDAFSGVSGNPLAAWAAKEIIRYGGAANLAETDELIGAEAYVLANVRDLATAERFLATIERFKQLVARHGHTAEGNPSGGNIFRGLVNIALKSLGAATKRHPDVRLDHVIDYAAPMPASGFTFMDSPGNDLESIAGQVASGSNLLSFITGNGSITNFPFVPTIKIVTTSERFALLSDEMDVNAGAYLDGTPMDVLGAALVDLTLAVAGGQRTAGERAGHAQVSIWRDWQQTGPVTAQSLEPLARPAGRPALTAADIPPDDVVPGAFTFEALATEQGDVTDQVGMILPTSLCAGQIALRIAGRLNQRDAGRRDLPISRYVALPHTEGCGVSSGSSEEIYLRTLVGHLLHPLVGPALLLEHGCEKTHNDYLRHILRQRGIDPARFGWASIQLDGGIDAVIASVEAWFDAALAQVTPRPHRMTGLEALRIGVAAVDAITPEAARAVTTCMATIVAAGGTVVVPESSSSLTCGAAPTLAYADIAVAPGLHVMETPTAHWVETLTGLAATGAEVVLVWSADRPLQGHRMVPTVQVTIAGGAGGRCLTDFDLALDGDSTAWAGQLLELLLRVAGRAYRPRLAARGNVDFQITRGRFGVSM